MKKLIILASAAILTFPIARAAEDPKPDLGEWAIVGEGQEKKEGVTEYALKNGGKLWVKITFSNGTKWINFIVTDKDGREWQRFGGAANPSGRWGGQFVDRINVSLKYPYGTQTEGGYKPDIDILRSGKGVLAASYTFKITEPPHAPTAEGRKKVAQDEAEEFATLKKAAAEGDADAQNSLGVMYQTGRSVPRSNAKAAEWYQKAAKQGHAKAQNNLATMYDEGQGVPRDARKAIEWYQKAAEQGFVIAQANLGVIYI